MIKDVFLIDFSGNTKHLFASIFVLHLLPLTAGLNRNDSLLPVSLSKNFINEEEKKEQDV
jgi:hypothetical protein